jgi:ech hydrogenase subunit A
MKDYHAREPQVRPRINFFFFIVFLFLSAMFGLVFSNNLIWIYFFWEITTFCSFLLIGYSESDEARANAFRALEYNLLGGVAFAAAIFFLCWKVKIIELDRLMALNKMFLMVPVALIGLAGITKSAQFPFSSWLLGAMVAPTPVSALLHSSTMVKAGVYIVLRFALILDRTLVGYALALIGGISFLASSLMAVSQDNAKRALAHSTIANLGLVMMCAGIGTPEAVWAGILLMIFHAFTKGLLFLCVGIFEDKMHSRAIEDMSGLTMAMPRLSVMMQVGMAGMFLAPFGMLVSKWAVIKALVDFNPVLTVFVVFGSAATVLLWVKWMGRLIVVTAPLPTIPTSEVGIGCSVWLPLWTLTILAVMLIALFPCVSEVLIAPYIAEVYNTAVRMGHDNVAIMSVMLVLVMLFPLGLLKRSGKVRVVSPYLGGANTPDGGGFYGATDAPQGTLVRSYYFEKYFSEERLFGVSEKICFWLAAIMLMIALI